MELGDALKLRRRGWTTRSIDFIATDPPYNPQLKITMAGGKLAETHANRRTDYAMITPTPRTWRTAASYEEFLDRMGALFVGLRRVLKDRRYAVVIVRDAYQDGTYRFTGSDLAARAAAAGLVPKGDLIWYQAGTRLRPYGYPQGVRAQHRPPAHPGVPGGLTGAGGRPAPRSAGAQVLAGVVEAVARPGVARRPPRWSPPAPRS